MNHPFGSCGHSSAAHPGSLHPIDMLIEEHEVILAVLEAMEKDARALQAGTALDRGRWGRYPEFLRNFADRCHHGKEEELLFPALVARDIPDAGGPIGMMKQEHEEGRALIGQLAGAIERGEARAVVTSSLQFVHLLRDHIGKENGVLFPLGKRVLEPGIVAELAAGFDRAERDLMGEDTHCKYVALAQSICGDAGVEFARRRGASLDTGCCGHHH